MQPRKAMRFALQRDILPQKSPTFWIAEPYHLHGNGHALSNATASVVVASFWIITHQQRRSVKAKTLGSPAAEAGTLEIVTLD